VAYAKRRFAQYLKRQEFDRMVAKAERQARSEGHGGKALEARAHVFLRHNPEFLEVASEARSLAADKDQALMVATGQAALFSTGDPEINREKATECKAHAELLRLRQQVKLDPSVIRELPSDLSSCVEVLRLLKEQEDDQRLHGRVPAGSDRWMVTRAERKRRDGGRSTPKLRAAQ